MGKEASQVLFIDPLPIPFLNNLQIGLILSFIAVFTNFTSHLSGLAVARLG